MPAFEGGFSFFFRSLFTLLRDVSRFSDAITGQIVAIRVEMLSGGQEVIMMVFFCSSWWIIECGLWDVQVHFLFKGAFCVRT